MTAARIEAREITHAFGATPVLAGTDVALEGGEVTGLIGPNGAGKTTLLRVLAGLIAPDGGKVLLDGVPLESLPPRKRAMSVAYLAQGSTAHWAITARALVALGRLPHLGPWRGPGPADRAAVARALGECDAASFAERPVNELSGGERARVMLARALAAETPVMLADEPIAGLDPAHAIDVMKVLRGRARGGAAVAVVMHDLTLAARHCDRLVLLAGGRVLDVGTPASVLCAENLARAYSVRALHGVAEGLPFIVPIARTQAEGGNGAMP